MGMLISCCNNVEMNRWISDNIVELTNMPSTDEFEQAIRNSHNAMTLNKGLPSYDGKEIGAAQSNVKSMSTQRQRQDQWERKLPCFSCGEDGHVKKECNNPNIVICTISDCKKKHNKKAHQNMVDYLTKREAKKYSGKPKPQM